MRADKTPMPWGTSPDLAFQILKDAVGYADRALVAAAPNTEPPRQTVAPPETGNSGRWHLRALVVGAGLGLGCLLGLLALRNGWSADFIRTALAPASVPPVALVVTTEPSPAKVSIPSVQAPSAVPAMQLDAYEVDREVRALLVRAPLQPELQPVPQTEPQPEPSALVRSVSTPVTTGVVTANERRPGTTEAQRGAAKAAPKSTPPSQTSVSGAPTIDWNRAGPSLVGTRLDTGELVVAFDAQSRTIVTERDVYRAPR